MIIRLHFAILHEFFMSERKKRLSGNPGRRQFVDKVRFRDSSVQEVLELLRARRMTQLAQRLGLDLADTLTGYVELLADLLEGAGMAVLDAEAQAQDAFPHAASAS